MQHLLDMVRKPWVALLRLKDEKGCNAVAKHWLNKKGATWKEFQQACGIDLRTYLNYYVEIGGEDAPTSPFLPGQISPILVIYKRGNGYVPLVVEVKGFAHSGGDMAWVKTDHWEALLGDTDYLEKNFPKVEKQTDKGWQAAQDYAQRLIAEAAVKRGQS